MGLEPLLLGPVTTAADGCHHPATRDMLSALKRQRVLTVAAEDVQFCWKCFMVTPAVGLVLMYVNHTTNWVACLFLWINLACPAVQLLVTVLVCNVVGSSTVDFNLAPWSITVISSEVVNVSWPGALCAEEVLLSLLQDPASHGTCPLSCCQCCNSGSVIRPMAS
jgi:hypothetical protein